MDYASIPNTEVGVNLAHSIGPLELWRHSIGHGGINVEPLPEPVVAGLAALSPRLVRVFIQESHAVYPERGRFDWSRLDPYLDSFARTGATVVAALCVKPPPLYPRIDHAVWQPTDWREWQAVVEAVVRRYSVERPIVTHWEVGNEPDIGEAGGSPYLMTDPEAYSEYYRRTVEAVRRAHPAAKVGGPAAAGIGNEPLPGLVERCRERGLPLDFLTWHLYHDDPAAHTAGIRRAQQAIADWPAPRPELMVTEWNQGFESVSLAEAAVDPARAARAGAIVLAMLDAGLDGSFYYHARDQVFDPRQFGTFFSAAGIREMVRHWNEVPHRFGLFGVEGEPRPQFFLYRMLQQMGGERVAAACDEPGIRVLAGRSEVSASVLLVNGEGAPDHVATLTVSGLAPGPYHVTTWRVDGRHRWDPVRLALQPVERRPVWASARFRCQVLCLAGSVTLVTMHGASI